MYFLGIDSGTQSTKAIVLDLDTGKILASGSKSYDLIKGLPAGHLEQNPADWINAVDASIKQCLAKLGKKKSPKSQRHLSLWIFCPIDSD